MENFQCHRLLYILALKINKLLLLLLYPYKDICYLIDVHHITLHYITSHYITTWRLVITSLIP